MIKNLAFVEVVVRDFDKMLRWYTEVLNFELSGEIVVNEDGKWCLLATASGDARFALWQPSQPNSFAGNIYSPFIPIFEVCILADFVCFLTEHGVDVLEEIRERGSYYITTIADPEGNVFQLFEKK